MPELTFQFNPESMRIPGYLAFQRLLNSTAGELRNVFDGLDLYDGKSAEEFLEERLKRFVPPEDIHNVVDLCLAFAVMTTLADRQQRGEDDRQPPPAEAFVTPGEPEPGSEAYAEREQTQPVRF